jgi:hypothetical protein
MYASTAIEVEDAAVLGMDRCSIVSTAGNGVQMDGCKKSYVRNCLFEDIGDRALHIGGAARPVVSGSVFRNIFHEAVSIQLGASAYLGNLANLNDKDDGGNSFEDPGKINVYNTSGNRNVKAENNWWGYTSRKEIAEHSVCCGPVDFVPFLEESPEAAGTPLRY